jgi:tRNA nucleotidyltransferase (CCA-adding enzyme)
LDHAEPNAIALNYVACEDASVQEILTDYLVDWRHITSALNGHDLRDLGVPRGPIYREILNALRAARLDGAVHSREEEVALALQIAERAQ